MHWVFLSVTNAFQDESWDLSNSKGYEFDRIYSDHRKNIDWKRKNYECRGKISDCLKNMDFLHDNFDLNCGFYIVNNKKIKFRKIKSINISKKLITLLWMNNFGAEFEHKFSGILIWLYELWTGYY